MIKNYNGLLEHGFQFNDIENPNLFRTMYPYKEIPKLIFNQRVVPMKLSQDIHITDTTLIDAL